MQHMQILFPVELLCQRTKWIITEIVSYYQGIAEILMNRPHARNSLGKVFVNEVSMGLACVFGNMINN